MRERPIIFNADMVRAVLDGRKTQTRRIIAPTMRTADVQFELHQQADGSWTPMHTFNEGSLDKTGSERPIKCPFGAVGDRLWVRETFNGFWLDDDVIQEIKDGISKASELCSYRADYPDGSKAFEGWTPSIHMPRWASRIALEITGVRVERLQDINHDDAYAEGIHTEVWDQTVVAKNYRKSDAFFQFWSEDMDHYVEMDELYRQSFGSLWQSIYGDDSWQANPWVWVIEFKRVEVQ